MSSCKYCKQGGLRWNMTRYGWRLFTPAGMHTCQPALDHYAREKLLLTTKVADPQAPNPVAKLTTYQQAHAEYRASYYDPVPPYVPRVREKQVHPLAWFDDLPSGPLSGPEFEFA